MLAVPNLLSKRLSQKWYNYGMMERQRYPTDLTDKEWQCLGPLVPAPKPGGRPAKHSRREIVKAMSCLRTGCQWRMLPHDFPLWKTVCTYFHNWRLDGTWQRIHDALREQLREVEGRHKEPSAAILDSQSVKTTEKGRPRGFDAANIQDRDGAKAVLAPLTTKHWRLWRIWADGGYRGELEDWVWELCQGRGIM